MKMLLILPLLICAGNLCAQDFGTPQWARTATSRNRPGTNESSLQGEVLKHDGSPATGVTVRISGASGSQSVLTNEEGRFEFTDLPWGTYDIEAEAGTSSVHRTLTLNTESPEVTLQFEGQGAPEDGVHGNSISVRQLKVPDKARKKYEQAVEEAARQNNEKALGRIAQALADFSCYSDALALKAVLDLSAGRAQQAVTGAQQAVQCDGGNGNAYFVLGAAFNARGQYQDAIRTLNEGIRFQPDAWQPYYELGKSLIALHRPAEAVAQLRRAEALSREGYAPIHATLAEALLQVNDYANARTQLLAFLKAAPNSSDAEKVRTVMAQIDAKLHSGSPQAAK